MNLKARIRQQKTLDQVHALTRLGHQYLRKRDWCRAEAALSRAFRLRCRYPDLVDGLYLFGGFKIEAPFDVISVQKLRHDLDHVEYLVGQRRLERGLLRKIAASRRLLSSLPRQARKMGYFFPSEAQSKTLQWLTDNPFSVYLPAAQSGGAINPKLDFDSIEREYRRSGFVVVDDLLRPSALRKLQKLCLESPIWCQPKPYEYIGTSRDLCCGLIMQVSREATELFPKIFQRRIFQQAWAYQCDNRSPGLRPHADDGVLNINLWITPDEANLNASSGGMMVYPVRSPKNWSFTIYNGNPAKVREYLRKRRLKGLPIPYRCNRAVIFDPSYLHESQRIRFAPGFENRRTNISFLYD